MHVCFHYHRDFCKKNVQYLLLHLYALMYTLKIFPLIFPKIYIFLSIILPDPALTKGVYVVVTKSLRDKI